MSEVVCEISVISCWTVPTSGLTVEVDSSQTEILENNEHCTAQETASMSEASTDSHLHQLAMFISLTFGSHIS